MKHILIFVFSFVLNNVFAQPGTLDPSFGGGDGFIISSFSSTGYTSFDCITLQPDGKILQAGGANITGSGSLVVARFKQSGTPDDGFGTGGHSVINQNSYATSIVVQPDGKILVAAGLSLDSDDDSDAMAVYRFNPDGSPDPSFDGDGLAYLKAGAVNQEAYFVVLQPDGKIVVAGFADMDSGYEGFALARFNADGSIDHTFNGTGYTISAVGEGHAWVSSLLLQPDGKLVAAGSATFNGYNDFAVQRFLSNGTKDLTFNGTGTAVVFVTPLHDQVEAAVIQPDEKILLAGYSNAVFNGTSNAEFAVVRLNPNGTPDQSFNNGGIATLHVSDYADEVRAVALQADGKILLGGYAHSNLSGVGSAATLVRLLPNGMPDNSFGASGIAFPTIPNGISSVITSLAVQADGKIVAGGYSYFNGLSSGLTLRLLSKPVTATQETDALSGSFRVFPNPADRHATLSANLAEPDVCSLSLFDAGGRLVALLASNLVLQPGNQNIPVELPVLPDGIYTLLVTGKKEQQALRIVVNQL